MKMNIKRFMMFLLSVTVFLVFVPLGVFATEIDTKIKNGYITYAILEDDTALVYDCDTDAEGVISIKDSINGYPVVSIGSAAFKDCTGITGIIIPDSIINIENKAFYNCTGIADITIPSSVVSIGIYAFYNCAGLADITISDIVTNIGVSAFEDTAYYNNSANWENDILYIGKHLIEAKNNISGILHIKEDTVIIADKAFGSCGALKEVIIPSSVKNVGDSAFSGCNKLVNISISDGVITLGSGVFSNCTALTNISIPDSVVSLGSGAFMNCTGLTKIIISRNVKSIDGSTFSGCTGLKCITIPDSVKEIDIYAFENCTGLKEIIIPNSVISIGKGSFKNCLALTEVYYSGTENEWNAITVDYYDNSCLGDATIYYNSVVVDEAVPTIGISLNINHTELNISDNLLLTATISPINATNKNVIWTSSNTSVATVENGTVTAVSAGTATITATTEDGGYTATCMVTVNEVEIPPVIDENAPMVKVESVKGKAGESITVPLYIENNPGVLGMMLKVSYDEELTLTAITQSTGEDNSALESLDFTPGKDLTANPINVGWDGLDADSTNGKILNMTFTIPEDAEDGKVYDVKISYSIGDVYDNDFNDIDLAVVDGSITVKNYTIGDVNDDGTINMKDVTLLRRGVIGGYGVTLNEAADVNCDGVTNMKDVTILRRYVIGGYGVTLG